jgi:hypothetical protein
MAAFTALAIASLVVGAYGAAKQAKAQHDAGVAGRQAADSQASIADFNASVADQQSADAIARGQQEEDRFRMQVRGLIGSQRAGFAASNVDVSYGSPVDVQADSAFLGELDALTIRTNARREAWGYQVQATDLRNRAKIARQTGFYSEQAGNALATSSAISGASNLLTGTANLLQTRYGFQQQAA